MPTRRGRQGVLSGALTTPSRPRSPRSPRLRRGSCTTTPSRPYSPRSTRLRRGALGMPLTTPPRLRCGKRASARTTRKRECTPPGRAVSCRRSTGTTRVTPWSRRTARRCRRRGCGDSGLSCAQLGTALTLTHIGQYTACPDAAILLWGLRGTDFRCHTSE